MVAFLSGAVLTAANLNSAFNALTFRAVTGTSDTFLLADNGGAVSYSNASPNTATVPPFSSVAYANGTVIELLNLGAGVVTVTAGVGVTINGTPVTLAQNVGGRLIKTATNTWYFLPGVSASGMDLVATAAPSAASSVIISNCFSAAYDNYRAVIRLAATTAGYVTFNLRTASTDAITNYSWQLLSADSTTITANRFSSQTAARSGYVQASGPGMLAIELTSPFLASATMYQSLASSAASGITMAREDYFGTHNTATSYESITFNFATAMTGTIKIYGYKNS